MALWDAELSKSIFLTKKYLTMETKNKVHFDHNASIVAEICNETDSSKLRLEVKYAHFSLQ